MFPPSIFFLSRVGNGHALDFPEDGGVVVLSVRGCRIAEGAVRSVNAAVRAQLHDGPRPETEIQEGAGQIHKDIWLLQAVLPEGTVEGNACMGVDELEARMAFGQAAVVARLLVAAQVDEKGQAPLLAKGRRLVEHLDGIAVPVWMGLDSDPEAFFHAFFDLFHGIGDGRVDEEPASKLVRILPDGLCHGFVVRPGVDGVLGSQDDELAVLGDCRSVDPAGEAAQGAHQHPPEGARKDVYKSLVLKGFTGGRDQEDPVDGEFFHLIEDTADGLQAFVEMVVGVYDHDYSLCVCRLLKNACLRCWAACLVNRRTEKYASLLGSGPPGIQTFLNSPEQVIFLGTGGAIFVRSRRIHCCFFTVVAAQGEHRWMGFRPHP